MRTGISSALALTCGLALVLTGCSARPAPGASSDPPSPALQRWYDAQTFLAEQTTSWEVVCTNLLDEGADPSSLEPFEFLSFTDREQWEPFVFPPAGRRDEEEVLALGRTCAINVPMTVPFVLEEIQAFLEPLGLYVGDGDAPSGLKHADIVDPRQGAGNLTTIYVERPGLWGAAIALASVRDAEGNPVARDESGNALEPETDEQAVRWLGAVRSLLDWYGYSG